MKQNVHEVIATLICSSSSFLSFPLLFSPSHSIEKICWLHNTKIISELTNDWIFNLQLEKHCYRGFNQNVLFLVSHCGKETIST